MSLTMEDLASAEVGKVISTTDAQAYEKVDTGWWTDEKGTRIRERHFIGLANEGKLHLISDMPLQAGQICVDGEWSYVLIEQAGENWHVACVSERGRAPVVGKSSPMWLTPRRIDDAKVKGKDNVIAMAKMVIEARGVVSGLEEQVDTLTKIGEDCQAAILESEAVKESLRNWLALPVAAAVAEDTDFNLDEVSPKEDPF